jgi:DNA-directed RNA polymerase subunit RPC12/RpoP
MDRQPTNYSTQPTPVQQPPPHEKARCPNCGKRGKLRAPETLRMPDGKHRKRVCLGCTHEFETDMQLPLECPNCDAFNNFRVTKTKNLRNGVHRIYRCRECNCCIPTFEPFPVPEEKRKRPDIRKDY